MVRRCAWVLAMGFGCGGTAARIEVPPSLVVSDRSPLPLDVRVVDDAGDTVADAPLRLVRVGDPSLLVDAGNLSVRCLRYGRSFVEVEAGEGLRGRVEVDCQVVGGVSVSPASFTATVTRDKLGGVVPVELGPVTVSVTGLEGEPVAATPIFSSAAAAVAVWSPDGARIRAVGRGRTELKATVGAAVGVVTVDVSEEALSRPLILLPEGTSERLPVGPGDWSFSAEADQGVVLSVEGASCASAESKRPQLQCRVAADAMLIVQNPGVQGLASKPAQVAVRGVLAP